MFNFQDIVSTVAAPVVAGANMVGRALGPITSPIMSRLNASGLLPGGGITVSSYAAYAAEKKLSKNKHEFGKGAVEGVAAPEAANNASAQVGYVPLLALGLPENAVMAIMLGAFMMYGLLPGPTLMMERPDIFWGLTISMLVGNFILLMLNVPLVRLWTKILSIPYTLLSGTIPTWNQSTTGNAATATYATNAGTASTATKLAATKNINGVAFDGSADITITAIADAGTLSGTTLNGTILNSSLTSVGTLASLTVTNPITGSVTGNAATATKLAATKNINEVAFDGSADISIVALAG